MEFKTTGQTERSGRGYTLVEVVVAAGVASILFLTLMTFAAFAGRSFQAMTNYQDLDRKSRGALDQLSRDIRRASYLVTNSSTRIVLMDTDGTNLTYDYSSSLRQLRRVKGTMTNSLLTECDSLKFGVYQRTPIGGTYEQFSNATPSTCKLIQLEWVCSRKILGSKLNTESVQSAKIVIRDK